MYAKNRMLYPEINGLIDRECLDVLAAYGLDVNSN